MGVSDGTLAVLRERLTAHGVRMIWVGDLGCEGVYVATHGLLLLDGNLSRQRACEMVLTTLWDHFVV